MKTVIAVLCAALLAAPAAAQRPSKAAPPPAREAAAPGAGRNVKITFKIKNGALEGSGNFVIGVGNQANYVVGGEKPREIDAAAGKGVEFKKYGTIFNALVAAEDGSPDVVSVQMQVEISGPLEPAGSLKVPPTETFQYQTSFSARLGRPVLLVDEPWRKVEVLVEDAVPAKP